MSYDDGIVIARGNTGTELFTVPCFKVLLGCNEYVGGWIQLQKLRRPLFGKVIGDYKQALLAEPQPLAFHSGSGHCESFPCSHNVRKQRVSAIDNARDGVYLMRPQRDFGIHADKPDMTSVIFAGTYAVELGVVERGQPVTTVRLFPYPVAECVLYELLLLLRKYGFISVQYALLTAAFIIHGVEYANIFQVQCFLNYLVCIDALCAVGNVCCNVAVVAGFA